MDVIKKPTYVLVRVVMFIVIKQGIALFNCFDEILVVIYALVLLLRI